MNTQDTTLSPLLAALKEKITEAIKVYDNVGRSSSSNCYAHNTRAVVKICELQESIERDLAAIAAQAQQQARKFPSVSAEMVYTFHRATTDAAIGKEDFHLTQSGLASVFGSLAEQAQGVPAGWKFSVSHSDGRAWLNITTPAGTQASLSCAHKTGNGDETVAAQVLAYLRDDLLAAAPQAEPQPEREPLTDAQIEKLREQTFSTSNPFCPCDSKTMRKAVWAAERAHGIGTKGGKPMSAQLAQAVRDLLKAQVWQEYRPARDFELMPTKEMAALREALTAFEAAPQQESNE